jgi:acetylornithine/N-succinyldiaminopimelate aminotransferase
MTRVTRDMYDQYLVPNYSPAAVIPVRGEGSRIWDQDDRCYIDFAGGIAVNALGHAHPKVVSALQTQAQKLWHLSNVFTNEPALRLAKKLCDATFAEQVYFCNSGGEANEAAFKLARRYSFDQFDSDKNQIISFHDAFHGRTLFTVSVGGQEKYTEGFGPLPGGISHLPFNDVEALGKAINKNTCAVVIEPVQGEGGVTSATPEFLAAARRLCDQHNALLIFDEVQCGMGRTGDLYAYQTFAVVPDILTTAKALGCGFPIGAMLTTEKIAKSLAVGTHGSTYGGNPLACAVAESVIDIINTSEVLEGVVTRRQTMVDGLNTINSKYPMFEEVRGAGLLIGWVLNDKWKGRSREILNQCMSNGLMLLVAGPDVVRFAPSLIITDQEIAEGLQLLEQSINQLYENSLAA